MRILLINANTSAFVTEKAAAEATLAASPGTSIVAVTGDFGPRVITTRSENAIAGHSTIALAAEHAAGCDAAVIAVSYDTGLPGAREALSIPVVGMTEAGLLTACMLGGRIGIVVFGQRVLPMYQELVNFYGLSKRIASWRVLESSKPYAAGDQSEVEQSLIDAANDLVRRDGAEVVFLAGAVMAGVPRKIQASVPVPLLDGIGCGVRQAEVLVRLGVPKPTAGSYALPPQREMVAVSPAIERMFGPRTS